MNPEESEIQWTRVNITLLKAGMAEAVGWYELATLWRMSCDGLPLADFVAFVLLYELDEKGGHDD